MKKIDYFKDKKVTVMGLGLLGRGIGDAKYIAESGAREVVVTDLKSREELESSVAVLENFTNVRFVLGEHKIEDFTDTDLVLMAAGVPLSSPYIKAAKEAGVEVTQSAALFAKLSLVPIIGVTGTRGKSTVTHMIHHVLSTVTEGAPVLLGGNIRGVSNLQLLNDAQEDSLCVMELDSWQLQAFGDAAISPQIAVFTSFMPDHMNYYGGDMDLYFKDKANIYVHQEDSGVLITTPEVFTWIQKSSGTLGQELILADASAIPEDCLLSMPGEHNRLNAALAYEALKATGLTDEEIFDGLASFPGVPGRLEYLGSQKGVKIYNDNNATTPTATAAGIKAVAEGKNVVLIMGGANKGLETNSLEEAIAEHVKKVVLLPGTGTDNFKKKLEANSTVNRTIVKETPSLKEAIAMGLEEGKAGDVLLFSPAFASFGMYKNEYERNDEFVSLIAKLEDHG